MKKILFLVVAVTISCITASAQMVQRESFEFNKQQINGYTLTFSNKTADVVGGALKERLEKVNGLKPGKKVSNFQSYPNQQLAPLGLAYVTIYTKVVEEGGKNSKVTKLYFAVFSDNGMAITPTTHPSIDEGAVQYLTDFTAFLIDYENNQKLIAANNLLTKQKKELDGLNNDKAKLNKDNEKALASIATKEKEIISKQGAFISFLQGHDKSQTLADPTTISTYSKELDNLNKDRSKALKDNEKALSKIADKDKEIQTKNDEIKQTEINIQTLQNLLKK